MSEAPDEYPVETYVPYDESAQWELHDAYYAARGIDAFRDGEVPNAVTNNPLIAEKHADVILSHLGTVAKTLGPRIDLVEIGGGAGRFAANLMEAVRTHPDPSLRSLGERIRYVLTDYTRNTLLQAAATTRIKRLIDAGTLVPAVMNLSRPDEIATLDGETLGVNPTIVLGNYITCVTRAKQIRRVEDHWEELWAQLRVRAGEEPLPEERSPEALRVWLRDEGNGPPRTVPLRLAIMWRRLALEEVFPQPPHPEILAHLFRSAERAPCVYPHPIISFLQELERRLPSHGLVLLSDYSYPTPADDTSVAVEPTRYGNSVNHAVDFEVFDAFAAVRGWGLRRTRELARQLHHIALSPNALPSATVSAFEAQHVESTTHEDLVDFQSSAFEATETDLGTAIRYYRRAAALAPNDVGVQLEFGRTLTDAGLPSEAIRVLNGAMAQPEAPDFDVEFELGRAHAVARETTAALSWYRASLVKDDNPATHTNIGELLLAEGEDERARDAFEAALAREPSYGRAQEALRDLEPAS